MSISAVGSAGTSSPSGKPQSVSQLRAKITQMKQQLMAVKNDTKTDCKTKDWKMQSLQCAIATAEVQVNAKQAGAAKQGKVQNDDDDSETAPKLSAASGGQQGTLVDCYA